MLVKLSTVASVELFPDATGVGAQKTGLAPVYFDVVQIH